MTKDEALRLALEALYGFIPYLPFEHDKPQCDRYDQAITAIKAALEAKDEPVAWMYDWTTSEGEFIQNWTTSEAETLRDTEPTIITNVRPLYTTPPQRTWVKLTNEQYLDACKIAEGGNYMVAFQRIQQWLKEKNT